MNHGTAYTAAAVACPASPTKGPPLSPRRRPRQKSSLPDHLPDLSVFNNDPRPTKECDDDSSSWERSPTKPPKSPWRRRLRSTSPARRLPDFLANLPLEKDDESPTKERRPSLGKNIRSAFSRSNSFTKLFSSSWDHNSASTETTWNSSFASQLHHSHASFSALHDSNGSLDHNKVEKEPNTTSAAKELLQQVDDAIQVQTRHKEDTEERIVSTQEMAWARHDAGNEMGAILSMRSAHKSMTKLQRLVKALVELSELRARLVDEMATNGLLNHTNLRGRRRKLVSILARLKSADSTDTTMPSNEELLDQLYDIINVGEI
eukprot:scaffold34622_cov162-Amphora_coffeaeformis.AAC.12